MNILLVYPEFPDTFWSFKHALNFVDKQASSPPLGLVTVAALLPADWNKRLVDMNVTALKDADQAWADMVFVSAMVVQRYPAKELLARVTPPYQGAAGGRCSAPSRVLPLAVTDPNAGDMTPAALPARPDRRRTQKVYTTAEYADIRPRLCRSGI
jgi:hypothetical protein